MKIGYLTTYFRPVIGGAENNCFYLARELAKKYDVSVYTSDKKSKTKFKKYEIIDNIKINRFRSFRYKYYSVIYPKMLFRILKDDLDILHVHSIGFLWHDIIVVLKKIISPRTKIINTPHGHFMALKNYPVWQKMIKLFVEFIEKKVNRTYNKVIQVNPNQKGWMVELGFRKENIVFIPNGIPKETFRKTDTLHFIKKYKLKNKFIISYLGRIQEYKGIDQVIKVLPEIINIEPKTIFLIIGKDTGYRKNLERLLQELRIKDHVFFIENISEKEKLEALESSEIFILPSEWEAFGICVDPNTLIVTDEEIKQIKDICYNDKVLTHKGNFDKVLKIIKRKYIGNILRIYTKNDPLPLSITPEHPLYAIKTKRCRWIDRARTNTICKPSCTYKEHCSDNLFRDYKLSWIKARDLNEGDFIAYPIYKKVSNITTFKISDFVDMSKFENIELKKDSITSKKGHNLTKNLSYEKLVENLNLGKGTIYRVIYNKKNVSGEKRKRVQDFLNSINYKIQKIIIPNKIRLSKDVLRLFGYYLAEGNVGANGQIEFNFNSKERDYILDVKKIVEREFNLKSRIRKAKSRNGTIIGFNSVVVCELFKNLFGGYAKSKRVPQFIRELKYDLQKELVKGYWRGDGSITPNGYSISTSSKNLVYQFRDILLRLGIVPSISKSKQRDLYTLNINGIWLKTFCNIIGLKHKFLYIKQRDTLYNWVKDDYLFIRIKKIEKKHYKGVVYNLEVNKDNSYVGQTKTMHNCLLEAMAKKNAIISTKTEGGKFLIKNNINGSLYDFNDLKELKKALVKLIKNTKLRRKMQLNNIKKSKQFTWDKIAKDLEKVYLDAI